MDLLPFLLIFLLVPVFLITVLPLWVIYSLGKWMAKEGYSKIKIGIVVSNVNLATMLVIINTLGSVSDQKALTFLLPAPPWRG